MTVTSTRSQPPARLQSLHRERAQAADRAWIVESANAMSIAGLVFLAIALSLSVLLITDVLFDGPRVWIYTGAIALVIVVLWFVRPLLRYVHWS